jgi:hypothetical protein
MMDLIASAPDDILVPLGITLPKFLAAYKAANQLQGGISTLTIDFNFQNELNCISSTPQLVIEDQPTTITYLATGDINANRTETLFDEENDLEQEMMDATNAGETAAIRGRAAICHLICGAIFRKGPSNQSKNFIFNAKRMMKQSGLKPLLLSFASKKLPSM